MREREANQASCSLLGDFGADVHTEESVVNPQRGNNRYLNLANYSRQLSRRSSKCTQGGVNSTTPSTKHCSP